MRAGDFGITLIEETGRDGLFRVISLNANGIRAAARKGFFDWMAAQDADDASRKQKRRFISSPTSASHQPGTIVITRTR
jgi:2-polyprenyl-6-methoxyphenol hydroxylase-like FAD-dependent oxidoreductase